MSWIDEIADERFPSHKELGMSPEHSGTSAWKRGDQALGNTLIKPRGSGS